MAAKPRKQWDRRQADKDLRAAVRQANKLIADLLELQLRGAAGVTPFKDRLIRAALLRMRAEGRRYSHFRLEPKLLQELCRRLLDPATEIMPRLRWLKCESKYPNNSSSLYRKDTAQTSR